MTAPASARLITAEEFLHMPENEGAELVDGRIVEVPMGSRSSWIGGELLFRIRLFLATHDIGWVFPPDAGIAVWPNRRHVRKPDVMFIKAGRLKGGKPEEGWTTTVPDLVVEVVSPKDEIEEFERKLDEYRAIGVPLIWVLYPGARRAHVLGAGRPRIELDRDGVLDGEDILPGFTCSLAELFSAADRER